MKSLPYLMGVLLASLVAVGEGREKPNFVVIFADDLGYQDLGCFGSNEIKTPSLDRMAREGMRLTSFYAQTVCGPSRAALMTGCYPLRVAKKFNNQNEIHPVLHSREITIAEILKDQGYATACFGKWDLAGHRQKGYARELLPTKQGFDYFFGTPTSNDSVVNLLRNEEVIESKADMAKLTKRYSEEAIEFIRDNKDRPFFVYLPHTMPHIRLAATKEFRGKSKRGLYGDVVAEIDFYAGQIMGEIRSLGLDKDTYVIFTSDNGPWYLDRHPKLSKQHDTGGSHGGHAAPYRGHKTSAWDGGVRVPCIVWAPGRVPAASHSSRLATTMDLLPTLAKLAGTQAPNDRVIDGKDISDLIHGRVSATDERAFFYYVHTQLMAVRYGRWKLHVPRQKDTMKRWEVFQKESDVLDWSTPLLFDLDTDPGESKDIAAEFPEKVNQLSRLAEKARADIGDYDRMGENARFFDPQPRRPDIRRGDAE